MSVTILKANKVKQMIENNEFDLIIDLRNKENYLAGHIPDAINIPINEIPDCMDFLNQYKEKSILMYCGIGIQSKSAAKVLALNEFKKLYSLSNGIKEYKYQLVSE